MDVRIEIYNNMVEIAPCKFTEQQKPYILEAMQRYADHCLNNVMTIEVEIPIGFMNCGISDSNNFIADTNNSVNYDTLKFPLPKPKYRWNISHYENSGDNLQKKIVVLVDKY